MELKNAVMALGALAQDTRLAVFRLLVRSGPSGLAAGAVAEALGVVPATLSFHLKELEHAGLLRARRDGRQIYYAVDFEGIRGLLAFLTEDCCQGRPEICTPARDWHATTAAALEPGGGPDEKTASSR